MAIQTLNTIKKWFKTGLKPSQDQFWDTWDSFRHKFENIPVKDIEGLETTLDSKAERSHLEEHKNNQNAHAELFLAKEDKSQKGLAGGYVPLDEFSKIAHQYLNVINNLTAGGETSLLSAEQGVILQNKIDDINTLLSSDNFDLNTVQKIVDTVEQIQISIDSILVNDLTTGGATKALTAEMGKVLQTSKEDKSQKGIAGGYAPLNDLAKIASQYLTIINDLTTGGSASILSAEQGVVLKNQIDDINTLLYSDNVDLDTIQEIVDAIEEVQISIDTILVNDLTTGGVTKALTAEMGKKLDEIKLTATIATDVETQMTVAGAEDNKVVSRSKLFNWWENIKTKAQTVNAIWNFKKGIYVNNSTGNYVYNTQMLEDKFIAQLVSAGLGNYRTEITFESIKWFMPNGFRTGIYPSSSVTQDNTLRWPNKSGTIAIVNDFVNTAAGTELTPPLTIPSGKLLTKPVNGAIEATNTGIYYTIGGVRKNLITDYVIDHTTMDRYVYLSGNGTLGIREDFVNIITDANLLNDYSSNQFGKYTIDVSGIVTQMISSISDVKYELQMMISNSSTPTAWYTVSTFEDSRSNILVNSTLPLQISLSAELLLEDIGNKYIYITGRSSNAASESFFKTKTQDLKTSKSVPNRADMLVSFRIKATTNWNTASTTQDLLSKFGLTKMLKI